MIRKREPLDPAIDALLASERAFPPQPEETRRRALARAGDAVAQGASAMSGSVLRRLLAHRWLAAVAVGIVTAAAWAAMRDHKKSPSLGSVESIESPTPALSASEPAPATAPLEALRPAAVSAVANPAAGRGVAPFAPPRRSARADGYDAELRSLERARSATARGDYKAALAAIAEHQREFPAGKLAEEREVLRIKSLLGLGLDDNARSAASAFRRNFPTSALLPRVEEMVHGAP
jgi:hypothetical protein